jgi:1-acyl-sn-glycerol-3-phosphate acyltransferase
MYHYHPPLPKDPSLYNQTSLTEVSESDLAQLRRFPRYSLFQKLLHIVYFLIFGVVKLLSILMFAIIAAPFFTACCAIWRAAGRPESGRRFCRGLWALITRVLLLTVGIMRITFSGQIDPDASFIVPNHVCFFDGWLFLGLGFRPLGKRELLRIPCLKDMCEVYDGIPVDRTRSSGISQVLIESANDPNKPAILILPEGASTSGDYMFRFHLGAFLSDLPVQLVTIRYKIWGTTRTLHHISFFHHHPYFALVFLGVPWITVDVQFHESMTIKEIEGQSPRAFADAAGLRIASKLGVMMISLSSSALYKKKTE